MKMTNLSLVNYLNALSSYVDMKLPQKINYAIARNIAKISRDYNIYNNQLQKLFENYKDHMIKDEKGAVKYSEFGLPCVDNSVKEEFNKQIEDLLNIEIDVDLYYIDKSYFDYEDNGIYDVLSANDIIKLQSIICKAETGD